MNAHIIQNGCILIKKEPYSREDPSIKRLIYHIPGIVRLIDIRTTHIIAEYTSKDIAEIENKFDEYLQNMEIMLMEFKL